MLTLSGHIVFHILCEYYYACISVLVCLVIVTGHPWEWGLRCWDLFACLHAAFPDWGLFFAFLYLPWYMAGADLGSAWTVMAFLALLLIRLHILGEFAMFKLSIKRLRFCLTTYYQTSSFVRSCFLFCVATFLASLHSAFVRSCFLFCFATFLASLHSAFSIVLKLQFSFGFFWGFTSFS